MKEEKKQPESPAPDYERMQDDDLWMFGNYKAVERMKKLIV